MRGKEREGTKGRECVIETIKERVCARISKSKGERDRESKWERVCKSEVMSMCLRQRRREEERKRKRVCDRGNQMRDCEHVYETKKERKSKRKRVCDEDHKRETVLA